MSVRSAAVPPKPQEFPHVLLRPRAFDPRICLVIPCFNESETVERFVAEVDRALSGLDVRFVFVNDGSRDDTLVKLVRLAARDQRIRIVNLSRNFGKEAALTAGLDHADGDVVVPIDADLQDPPEVVRMLVREWRKGYDVVLGIRADRSSDAWTKRSLSHLFYRWFNKISDVPIPYNAGDFRLMDLSVVRSVQQLPERNRFMKGILNWVGFPTAHVLYDRPERVGGTTSFSFWKLWNLALDGIVGFSTLPLRVWTYLGVFIGVGSLLFAAWAALETLVLGRDVPGWTSIFTAILLFGSLNLITLGVIGEYLSRLFVEVKGRPIYLVAGVYGREEIAEAEAGAPLAAE